jgi:hypothetical protein
MQYLFCSVGKYAVAFALDDISLLMNQPQADTPISDLLVTQLGRHQTIADAFIGNAAQTEVWRVDRPLCLCEVPQQRLRSIPSAIVRQQGWAHGVIHAGRSLHHQLEQHALAWVVNTKQLTRGTRVTRASQHVREDTVAP